MTSTMPDETTPSASAGNDKIERFLQSGMLRLLGPPIVGVIAVIAGLYRGLPMALLVVAAGTLLAIVWLLWNSLQGLTGETPISLEEALGLGAPTAEEEQKRAVLRALKDLEYEHSVGKISEEDYASLTTRYRAEAKTLLRSLDQSLAPNREHAEKLLEERLAAARLGDGGRRNKKQEKKAKAKTEPAKTEPTEAEQEPAEAKSESEPADEAEATSAPEPELPATPAPSSLKAARGPTRRCAGCSTRNDLDARFCKSCGAAMAEDDQALCSACPTVYDKSLDACPECGVPQEDA